MIKNLQTYSENGVTISKEKIIVGDTIILTYDGLLAKSGADVIVAHIGYGDSWDEKAYIPMDAVDGVFKVTFKVKQLNDLNITFKDGADNWDNNSMNNYTFEVSEKAAIPKKPVAQKKVKTIEEIIEIEAKKPSKKTTKTGEVTKTKKVTSKQKL